MVEAGDDSFLEVRGMPLIFIGLILHSASLSLQDGKDMSVPSLHHARD